jgi:hypothetical protein
MEYTEQIERYLSGEMTGEELEVFRKELSMNPQLSALVAEAGKIQQAGTELFARGPADFGTAVENDAARDVASYRKDVEDPLSAQDIKTFRDKLERVERTYHEEYLEQSRTILRGRFWYYAAALVILAMVIPLLLIRYSRHVSSHSLYEAYYEVYSGNIPDKTRSDNGFLNAVETYRLGRYGDALRLFEPFIASEEYGAYALFYSGLACMGLERYSEAVSFMQRSLEAGKEELAIPAHWYLGLCYLAVNDAGAAIQQFKIVEPDPEFSGKAKRIIKKIRKVPGFSEE